MDFPLLLRHRLKELGIEQRDLAAATQVTESYISQLMTRKKSPPAPERTDIYGRMETFLRLPAGQLATLADLQRKEALKSKLADPPGPLFQTVRELILRKCDRAKEPTLRAMFAKEPFGALERFVTQKLLDVVKRVTKEELDDEKWVRRVARFIDRSYEEMRVIVIEFLETDLFNISADNCVTFLDPLIESWDIDLATFALDIILNPRVVSGHVKRFEFIEREAAQLFVEEPGLREFLQDPALSGTATEAEVAFLKRLKFRGKRPTPLYYYRELQNLRDSLHFHTL